MCWRAKRAVTRCRLEFTTCALPISVPVGGDTYANPGAANKNAALGLAVVQNPDERVGEIGVIHRFGPVGAKIENVVSQFFELLFDDALHGHPCVIAGDRNRFLCHGLM